MLIIVPGLFTNFTSDKSRYLKIVSVQVIHELTKLNCSKISLDHLFSILKSMYHNEFKIYNHSPILANKRKIEWIITKSGAI